MKITQQVATLRLSHSDMHPSGEWKKRWSDETWKFVDECRQTVGYQPGEDWECVGCSGTKEQKDELRAKYPGKYVCGGFIYAPCIVKEFVNRLEAERIVPVAGHPAFI